MASRKNTVPVSEWVTRINALITKTREAIFAIGEALTRAKEQLTKKDYKELLVRLQMSQSTADNYMRIASRPIFREPTITKQLPNGVGALIDIAAWNDDDIKNAISEGVMKPNAERGTLNKWINLQYKEDYKRRPKEFHDKTVMAWEVCVDFEKWIDDFDAKFGEVIKDNDPRRNNLDRLREVLQKTADEQFDELVVIRSPIAPGGSRRKSFSRPIKRSDRVDISGSVFYESLSHIANKLKAHADLIEPLWGSPLILKFIKGINPETMKVVPGLEKYGVINVEPTIDADNFSPETLIHIGRILTSADYKEVRRKANLKKFEWSLLGVNADKISEGPELPFHNKKPTKAKNKTPSPETPKTKKTPTPEPDALYMDRHEFNAVLKKAGHNNLKKIRLG